MVRRAASPLDSPLASRRRPPAVRYAFVAAPGVSSPAVRRSGRAGGIPLSILRRVRDILAAHLEARAAPATDPEGAAAELVHQAEALFTKFQVEYDRAVADQLAARQRLASARAEAARWEDYAASALRQGREDIARQALAQKHAALERIPALQRAADDLDATVAALQQTGGELRARLDRLRARRDALAARQHAAEAGLAAGAVAEALDPLALGGVMDRLEEALLDAEARAAAQVELAGPRRAVPPAPGPQAPRDPEPPAQG